ncbi:MAG: caspase family protein [Pirellulales bacterium]|nr:caspase family protein [Pirellulales bacterium]
MIACTLRKLLLTIPFVLSAAGSTRAADPSAADLLQHCRQVLQRQLEQPSGEIGRRLGELDPLVRLSPQQIQWPGDAPLWQCLGKRNLLPEEQQRVWDGLEQILVLCLSAEPLKSTGQPPLNPDQARRTVDRGSLGFLRQRPRSEVTSEEIKAAVLSYVGRVRNDAALDPPLDEAMTEIAMDPEKLMVSGDRIVWSVEPDRAVLARAEAIQKRLQDAGSNRGAREIEWLRQTKQAFERTLVQHAPAMRAGILRALADVPAGDGDLPLLSEADARSLIFELYPEAWALEWDMNQPVAAAAPMIYLRATASKGSAQRTLSSLQWTRFPADRFFMSPFPADAFAGEPAEAESPQLVVDTGGFAGGNVTAVAFSPDGRLLAAAGDAVRIWELGSGKLLHTLRGQRNLSGVGSCTDLCFSPDGRRLFVAAAGSETSVRIYDMADPSEIRKVLAGHEGHVDRLAVSADGRWLATAGVDNRLNICDLSKDQVVRRYSLSHLIDHLSFPTAESWLLAVDVAGKFTCIDLAPSQPSPAPKPGGISANQGAQQFQQWVGGTAAWPEGGRPHPFALAVDLAQKRLVAGGISHSAPGQSTYWCGLWSGGRAQPDQVHKHKFYVTACAFSRDAEWVASADAIGGIDVWNAKTGEVRRRLGTAGAAVYAVDFDPAGTRLKMGRTPLRPGSGWKYNHYGLLTGEFDILDRCFRSIDPQEPPEALLRREDRQLSLATTRNVPTLIVSRPGLTESWLPLAGSAKHLPLCFAFLRGQAIGFENAIAVGGEDGSLVCFEPRQFLSRRSFIGHSDRVWCLAQSPDGRLLASGSGDGSVRIWKLEEPRPWGNLAAYADENGRIYHVVPGTPTAAAGIREGDVVMRLGSQSLGDLAEELAKSGKWPFAAGEEVAVELETKGENDFREPVRVALSPMGDIAEPLLSLFVTPDGRDWVAWTPQGYYDASPAGDRIIGWHVNRGPARAARLYRAEQFREQFYRPDVIAKVLQTADAGEALALANAQRSRPQEPGDLRQNLGALLPPKVRIVEPAYAMRTGQPEIRVKAEVLSETEQPLSDVRVLVNGKAYTAKNIAREEQGADGVQRLSERHWVLSRNVRLAPGDNEIGVLASTEKAASEPVSVRVTYRESVAPDDAPRLFLLAVGISKYRDERFNLQFADRDAREFAEAWQSQKGGLYRDVQSRVLLNDQAIEPAVLDAMQWLVDSAEENDVALVFFSSHGVCDANQNYYLATHGIDTERIRSTALSWRDVQGMILDLRCRRLLMFVDTCHGGGVAGTSPVVMDRMRDLSKQDVGAVLFASCAPQAKSLEDPAWQHGAFTKALLDTLGSRESDIDNPPDGLLSLTDLAHNLDKRVRQITEGRQVPVVGIPPTVTNFSVYRIP